MSRPKQPITEFRNYYLPSNFPVLLLSGNYWKISDVPSSHLHFHNCLEIGVCHSAGGILKFPQESLTFKEGDVTCIPKNIPHTTYSNPGCESHWSYLFFDPAELFKNFFPGQTSNINLSLTAFSSYKHIMSKSEHPRIYHLVMQAIEELQEQKPDYQFCVTGILMALFVEIYRIQNENGVLKKLEPDNDSVLSIAPALNYIDENYALSFPIDTLAELCHLSPTHFRRIFRDIMGTNPLDYLNDTRIFKACNLLRSTDSTILSISEMVGFRSITSFNRHFTKVMQITPKTYRSQMVKAEERSKKQSIIEYKGWMYPESFE